MFLEFVNWSCNSTNYVLSCKQKLKIANFHVYTWYG